MQPLIILIQTGKEREFAGKGGHLAHDIIKQLSNFDFMTSRLEMQLGSSIKQTPSLIDNIEHYKILANIYFSLLAECRVSKSQFKIQI